MQLFVTFRGQEIVLPMSYRHILQGVIYHTLEYTEGHASATQLHDEGYRSDDRTFKLFTFGLLKGSYTIHDKYIVFHDTVQWEIRSIDEQLIRQLAGGLIVGSKQSLGKNEVEIVAVRIADEHIDRPAAIIAMQSPIVAYRTLEDNRTVFHSPEEQAFYAAIIRNAQRKWQSWYPNEPFELDIRPLLQQKFRKEATRFKQTFITAWYGCFDLSGLPEVLDFVYQTGLGAKSSQGFGMFTAVP